MSATGGLLRSHRPGGERLRVLSASGQLGFGIAEAALQRGLARRPHFIGCDMGSIDPGPFYLGSGEMAAPRAMVRRDLELLLHAARSLNVPLIIGSAGTAGARPHVLATLELLQAIAREGAWSLQLALVYSDVPRAMLEQAAREGRLSSLEAVAAHLPVPEPAQMQACAHVVAQCGCDTLEAALRTEPDVLVAGRSCDTAIFAALPRMLGYDAALALHMAKIIECTSLCCEPGGRDAMLAELGPEDFILESMNPSRTAAAVFKQNLLHHAYPGRLSTGGNLAFAFTPCEIDAGQSYRFVLYHLFQGVDPADVFRIEVQAWSFQEAPA